MGERTNGALKRRGLLAGAAALAATVVAKLGMAERAEATHATGGTPNADRNALHANTDDNVATFNTMLRMNGVAGGQTTGQGGAARAVALLVDGNRFGVVGGVRGARATQQVVLRSNFASSRLPEIGGVVGIALGEAPGVRGESTAGTGVFGVSQAGSGGTNPTDVLPPTSAAGVSGLSDAQIGTRGESASNTGVYGVSRSGPGVFGGSGSGLGVYAHSDRATGVFGVAPQRGVWGRGNAAGGIGVFGHATQLGGFGVYGAAQLAPDTWAGYFEGHVFIAGGLAGGRVATSAAQGSDGGLRTLYSLDTAEPVVEDFGEGTLAGGRAEITLDAEFAAVAEGASYQVFPTPYADCKGLAVTRREPGGFTVAKLQGGTSGVGVGYRVVAKRKGATGKRLERMAPPRRFDARELEPPKAPEMPRPAPPRPSAPDRSGDVTQTSPDGSVRVIEQAEPPR